MGECMACEFYLNKAFFFFNVCRGTTLLNAMKVEGKASLMGSEVSFADRDGAKDIGQVM